MSERASRLSGILSFALFVALGQGPMEEAVEVVATGLEIPWAIVSASDGRIFLTERPGRVRVVVNGILRTKPWATFDVVQTGDAGLRGLALSPDFEKTGHVFVLGTFRALDGKPVNRVYRLTDRDGEGADLTIIVDNLPCPGVHGGGALAFGPDGMLYVTMGDVRVLEAVQDLSSPVGKILRYRRDGTIPDDNPFKGSPVYALGVRNPQGLAWSPETGDLFATEHGPTGFPGEGGREDQDELNVISPRGNYGWPVLSGMRESDRFLPPIVEWTPAIAPAGLAIIADKSSPWYGNLFVGALRGQHLRRVVIERATGARAGWRVVEEQALFRKRFGRIRAVAMGPEGYLYFATSNRDSDGKELKLGSRDDDRLLRLRLGK